MRNLKFEKTLDKNKRKIQSELYSDDVSFIEVKAGNSDGLLIFVKDLVDKELVGELILKPLSKITDNVNENNIFDNFFSPEKKKQDTLKDFIEEVLSGSCGLIIDGIEKGFTFELKKFEKRAITEPPTGAVIKGPREGFVESVSINLSMIRRRLKTEKLTVENLKAGAYSKTQISLCYIKGVADDKLVEKIKEKINGIKIDAVIDASYVSKFIAEHSKSLFKQVGNTEKPDVLTGKILEGRIAVFVDGSPIALTLPYVLIEDFQSPADYYNSAYTASFARFLRFFSVVLSILLPAVFVSAQLFHLQLIPLSFLLTIVNSIKGIPLSPSYEMFFTLIIFEILNEASVRMPKYVGMAVSIVGGLVLGETAVNAGIISAPALMIIAFSGICLYTVPELERTLSFIRLIFLIIAGSFGIYGIITASVCLLIYLVSFESFSVPLFAPFSPLIKNELKDSLYKGFIKSGMKLPSSIKTSEKQKKKV